MMSFIYSGYCGIWDRPGWEEGLVYYLHYISLFCFTTFVDGLLCFVTLLDDGSGMRYGVNIVLCCCKGEA